MNDKQTIHFDTVTALAEYLGIARKTLYERAKAHGIKLTGDYTDAQIALLRERNEQAKSQSNGNNTSDKKHTMPKTGMIDILAKQLEAKDAQIAELNARLSEAHQLTLLAQNKVTQLETKLEQGQTPVVSSDSDEAQPAQQPQPKPAPAKKHWWQFG